MYSAPNQAMWCCVGTGMENHGKYGEFIYTHRKDSLFLNLFVASEVNWKEKGIKISQFTAFPEEEQTRLKIHTEQPTAFTLMIRSPKWVAAGKLKILVNNDTLQIVSQPQTYIALNRTWNNGDSVKLLLPMQNTYEQLPNVPSYIALMHGPVLLGAKTGTEDLTGLIADDSRWGHIASGIMLPLDQSPVLVCDNRAAIGSMIVPVKGKPLQFRANAHFGNIADTTLVLEPFYKIHDARYMMYWLTLTSGQYQTVLDSIAAVQKEALELEQRTIDKVAPGEQQPEVDHKLNSLNSNTGNYMNEFWRDARSGGFISYSMLTKGKPDLSLMVRYWGNESGSRSFNILVDDVVIATENLAGKWNVNMFKNVEYPIPNSLTAGKDTVTVKFQAINTSNIAGGLFYIRILQPLNASALKPAVEDKPFTVSVKNNGIRIGNLKACSSISLYDISGKQLKTIRTHSTNIIIPALSQTVDIVKIISDGKEQVSKVIVN